MHRQWIIRKLRLSPECKKGEDIQIKKCYKYEFYYKRGAKMLMNVLSLFDGISCGQIALKRAGVKVDSYYASEIDPVAIDTTQNNFPNTIQLGDVLEWGGWDLPQIDMIIGGSPCQGFSFAGNQLNFSDPRSKLFFDFVDVVNHFKPKYFLLENVRMKKEFQDVISKYLGVEPIVINSRLVSGQLRHRLYWTNIPNITEPKDLGIELQSLLTSGYTERVKSRCLLEGDSRPLRTPVKMFHRHYSTGFHTLVFKSKEHYEQCVQHYESNFKGMSAREIDHFEGSLDVYEGIRYLNQTELERLQTMPSEYTKGLTRNQAASVLGNGWTVDVVAHIFKNIKEF